MPPLSSTASAHVTGATGLGSNPLSPGLGHNPPASPHPASHRGGPRVSVCDLFSSWHLGLVPHDGPPNHDVPLGNSVAAQLVGHETTRFLALTLQELSEESPRRTPVPTGLDEKVNQVTVLVHGAPQILALIVDRDEDFVQKPRISESTLTSLQPPGVIGAELPAPLPNSFVRHDDAAFGQQILDIPEAQAASVIQSDGVADDFRRKAMPKVAGSSNVHPGIVPRGEAL